MLDDVSWCFMVLEWCWLVLDDLACKTVDVSSLQLFLYWNPWNISVGSFASINVLEIASKLQDGAPQLEVGSQTL